MPKKPEFTRGAKSDKEHSPMKDRVRKPGRGEASYDGEGRQKKDHGMKPAGGGKNPFGGMGRSISGSDTSTGRNDNAFDGIRNFSEGRKSKSGCFPKLFMLLLSIAAGAAYFYLGW